MPDSTIRVLVCGSRTWTDAARIRERLQLLAGGTIVVGGAVGADHLAAREGHALGLSVEVMPADWSQHGRAAGAIRNRAMLDADIDLVIAFWNGASPGTADTLREAKRRGIPTEVHVAVGR